MNTNIRKDFVRFKLRDFANQQELDMYISSQLGEMGVFVWHAFDCWTLVNSIYFELLRIRDERYCFIIQKFSDDTITIRKHVYKEKSVTWALY